MMECAYVIDDESCGEHADLYHNLPLCDVHRSLLESQIGYRGRMAALSAAKAHPVETFPGICYLAILPTGNVKIGFTANEETLKKRFRNLAKQYGAPLVPLMTLPGGHVQEAVLHARFSKYRVSGPGEQFYYSPEIAEFVADHVGLE